MAEKGHFRAQGKYSGKFQDWWQDNLGAAGPIISSLVGLLFLSISIPLLDYFGTLFSLNFLNDIGMFLQDYLVLFFILMVFFSYTGYLSRTCFPHFVWASPVIIASGFTISIWILIKVFEIMNEYWGVRFFDDVIEFVTYDFLMVIFAVVMVLGYLVLYGSFFYEGTVKK